jgi:hypothetical protein
VRDSSNNDKMIDLMPTANGLWVHHVNNPQAVQNMWSMLSTVSDKKKVYKRSLLCNHLHAVIRTPLLIIWQTAQSPSRYTISRKYLWAKSQITGRKVLNPHCRTLHCLGLRAARTCKPARRPTVAAARQQLQPCCHAPARRQSPSQQACRVIPFLACSLVSQPSCLLAEQAKKF